LAAKFENGWIPIKRTAPKRNEFRSTFFVPQAGRSADTRLISRASSWPQRASRAFAAELLAPAAELARHISTPVNYEQVGALARLFGVSEMVIEHQLQNHHIAELVDL